jgi:hypothetical protein
LPMDGVKQHGRQVGMIVAPQPGEAWP